MFSFIIVSTKENKLSFIHSFIHSSKDPEFKSRPFMCKENSKGHTQLMVQSWLCAKKSGSEDERATILNRKNFVVDPGEGASKKLIYNDLKMNAKGLSISDKTDLGLYVELNHNRMGF